MLVIKDFTLGQFYPSNSFVHKLDPRIKIIILLLLMVFVFCAQNFISLIFLFFIIFFAMVFTKVPLGLYFKNLKLILPILLFTMVINLFYTGDGTVLFEWWKLKITTGGISWSLFLSLRVIMLIFVSLILTYTTTPNDLTDAIERLLSPLKWIGLGGIIHTMVMMMTIAMRFIPTLVEEAEKIMNAQKARGVNFVEGNLFEKIKAIIPILIPLIISSIRRAYDLAEAMESRCYNGGRGKTRMKIMKILPLDIVILVLSVFICAFVIILNILF